MVDFAYAADGIFQGTLTVTDDEANTDTTTFNLSVTDPPITISSATVQGQAGNQVRQGFATAAFFRVLGVAPLHGRTIRGDDPSPDRETGPSRPPF